MNDTALLVVPLAMFAMVIGWFVMLKIMFNRLERLHPQKYEAMGRPTLFLRNNIYTGWMTLKFIGLREHRSLADATLSKLSDFMFGYFLLYLAVFVSLIAFSSPNAA